MGGGMLVGGWEAESKDPWVALYLFPGAARKKLPQTGHLKTTKIYSFAVLEARNLTSSFKQGHTPSKGSRKGFVTCLSPSF